MVASFVPQILQIMMGWLRTREGSNRVTHAVFMGQRLKIFEKHVRDLPGASLTDFAAVDLHDRNNLRRCTGQKYLVRIKKIMPRNDAFLKRQLDPFRDLEDSLACNAPERSEISGRCEQDMMFYR